MKLLVTGGAGFIGSTYVRLFQGDHEIVVLDKLTYAGRRENVPARVGELVEHDYLVLALKEAHVCGADESGAAGHEQLHARTPR